MFKSSLNDNPYSKTARDKALSPVTDGVSYKI